MFTRRDLVRRTIRRIWMREGLDSERSNERLDPMKTPNPKVLLTVAMTALGLAATLASPAFAQQREAHHQRVLRSDDPPLYNAAAGPAANSDIPYYGNAPYDQRDDW